MSQKRWVNRPEGSNWGDFGPDGQVGKINLLTPERRGHLWPATRADRL
jgi:hypothetical protein